MAQTINLIGVEFEIDAGVLALSVVERNVFQEYMHDDLDKVFFNKAEFANECVYTHVRDSEQRTYKCIYDDPTISNASSGTPGLMGWKPFIQISKSWMYKEAERGDQVSIEGKLYIVDEIDDDGFDILTLELKIDDGVN